ncbi:uncharacterized protein LOC111593312 [Drosophila hydei]|uniref:Uncharacterized protein LOC111593312 n=1 Tax=Drosophila hydei TaxID=7224 RepID=A0A6J1LBV2_DROHY|nr:uncharacterized protein LOC111593312 [Drosophila hydei]
MREICTRLGFCFNICRSNWQRKKCEIVDYCMWHEEGATDNRQQTTGSRLQAACRRVDTVSTLSSGCGCDGDGNGNHSWATISNLPFLVKIICFAVDDTVYQ